RMPGKERSVPVTSTLSHNFMSSLSWSFLGALGVLAVYLFSVPCRPVTLEARPLLPSRNRTSPYDRSRTPRRAGLGGYLPRSSRIADPGAGRDQRRCHSP